MPKYARIKDGVVREIQEFDSIEGRFHPSLVWVECPAEVEQRWLYDGNSFSPPSPPEVDPEKEAKEQARQERLQRLRAAKTDDYQGVSPKVVAVLKDILDELNLD